MIGAVVAYPVQYSRPVYRQQHPSSRYASLPTHYGYEPSPAQYQYAPSPAQYQHAPSPAQYHYAPSPAHYQYAHQPQYETVPVAYARVDPVSHEESAAQTHGIYGQDSSGHKASEHSAHGDEGSHKESALSTHRNHNTGRHTDHGTHGANHESHGTYRNTGSYSEDKGSGFEKSFSYDRATGYHDIESDEGSNSKSFGSATKETHHDTGAHSAHEQEKKSAHNKHGSAEHGSSHHNSSAFKKYGYTHSGKQQGYSYSPVYGYGYH